MYIFFLWYFRWMEAWYQEFSWKFLLPGGNPWSNRSMTLHRRPHGQLLVKYYFYLSIRIAILHKIENSVELNLYCAFFSCSKFSKRIVQGQTRPCDVRRRVVLNIDRIHYHLSSFYIFRLLSTRQWPLVSHFSFISSHLELSPNAFTRKYKYLNFFDHHLYWSPYQLNI